jgi:hypothetical protein
VILFCTTLPHDESLTAARCVIYIDSEESTASDRTLPDIARLDLALPDTGYVDDWPLTGDPPAPWLPPNARTHKPARWLPPRCHLPALVPRRDFPVC